MAARDSRPVKFTVIIAVYNGADSLQRCLDSVFVQTWPFVEVVVMDGGSTDGTVEILQRNDRRIAYWESAPDRGIYHAWNKALEHASGDWICFLGADDYFWQEDVLERLAPHLRDACPPCRVVYGRVALLNAKGEVVHLAGEPWERVRRKFRSLMALPHQGVMHHRSLFEAHGGFDECYRIVGDYELLLRELRNGEAVFVPDVIVTGMRLGGVSNDPGQSMLLLGEVRRAHRKLLGGRSGWRWWLAWGRVVVRNLLWRLLGEQRARKALDIARRGMGQSRYWTRS